MPASRTLFIDMKNEGSPDKLDPAADIIRRGGLVAFPTETVYGLGADALNPEAVHTIFEVKGRPPDNPLIVHISSLETLASLVREVPPVAEHLIGNFWPGPLTIVLPRAGCIPTVTTGGLDTVAIRMPDHPLALALIARAETPIAAPSANISGRPSPTCAEHVLCDLEGRIGALIDGGRTPLGVESTVVDLSTMPPLLLRPGGITREELQSSLASCSLSLDVASGEESELDRERHSPGMRYTHYAPEADMVIIEGESLTGRIEKIREMIRDFRDRGREPGLLLTEETACGVSDAEAGPPLCIKIMGSREDPVKIACNLFALLREFDREEVDVIISEGISSRGLGFAVMNRMRRAAGFNIISTG